MSSYTHKSLVEKFFSAGHFKLIPSCSCGILNTFRENSITQNVVVILRCLLTNLERIWRQLDESNTERRVKISAGISKEGIL